MTQTHAVAGPDSASPRSGARPAQVTPRARPARPQPSAGHEVDRYAVRRALVGPGRPVAPGPRVAVERASGADLSDVRVHTGPAVRVAALGAGAAAFTLGRDIGIGVGPGEPVPDRLLTHELVHAAQQGAPGVATADQAERQARAVASGTALAGVLAATGASYVAYAANDWLQTTPDVRRYGYSELLDELNAVGDWLARQLSSSPEVDRMQEASQALQAELARRDQAMGAPDRRVARRRGRAGRPAAQATELPPQTAMPRVLSERSSTALTDPGEIRTEVDRITAWLQRPDLTTGDRSILRQELATLVPSLGGVLAQASAQRRQSRLAQALTPSGAGDRTGVLANLRMIESIRPYQEQPGMAYVLHDGELLVFSQDVAAQVRADAAAALADAARGARQMNDSSQFRMSEHLRLNYEEQPYVGFVVSVVSGEEPVEVQARMLDPLGDSTIALRRFRAAQERGSLVEMGDAVFTAVERADSAQQIVLDGIDRAVAAAGSVVQGLTITRNLSFAIALSIGAILAAPVVAAGVAGFGVTGLGATALTAVGTSTVVGAGGFGLGFTGGAGGELLAGNGVDRALDAGLGEGVRVGGQGAAIGLGGGASLGLARNLGVGAEGLSLGQNLWRGALAQGTGNALGSGAGGLLAPPEGMGRGESALRSGLTGFGLGAFGGTAGAYARTLGSPGAQYAIGVGAPSVAAGGVTYLQTGDWHQAVQAGGMALTIGTLGQLRAPGQSAGERSALRLGASARQSVTSVGRTGRAYLAAAALGLAEVSPAVRMGSSSPSVTLSDPRTGGVGVGSSQQQAPVQQAQLQQAQLQQAQLQPVAQPPSVQAPVQAPSVRVSTGAFMVDPARLVTDPFSGQVLGQRSASAQTERSLITGIRADEGEAAVWRAALTRGEIGLRAPNGANVPGGDFYTARIDAGGQITLIATDVKLSTVGRFPTPATTMRPAWRAELQAAIQPGRLNLGDPALEGAIRAAFAAGRIQLRQVNADYSPAGGGTITGL